MTVFTSGLLQPAPSMTSLGFTTEDMDGQTMAVADTHYSGKVVDGGTVDPVPTTQTVTDANNMHVVIDVTAMATAGTLRLTGSSISEETEEPAAGDTEDIPIAGTGFAQSDKKWIGDVVMTSVGGLDVVLDAYRVTYFDYLNRDFLFCGYRMGWKPNSVVWDVSLDVDRVETNGSKTSLVSKAFANTDSPSRAQNGAVGFAKESKRVDPIQGSGKQGLVVLISGAGGSATKIQEMHLMLFIRPMRWR